MTKIFQKDYPSVTILFSPEFLSEVTAAQDAAKPFSNIVGMPLDNETYHKAAEMVHTVLPKAPFTLTCDSDEAEIIKYSHNIAGYTQVITYNIMYEMAQSLGHEWDTIKTALAVDPYINKHYINPLHKSGRGAGGHCFIKDFAAFTNLYEKQVNDEAGMNALRAFEKKNIQLLKNSNKDIDLLKEVYGKDAI